MLLESRMSQMQYQVSASNEVSLKAYFDELVAIRSKAGQPFYIGQTAAAEQFHANCRSSKHAQVRNEAFLVRLRSKARFAIP